MEDKNRDWYWAKVGGDMVRVTSRKATNRAVRAHTRAMLDGWDPDSLNTRLHRAWERAKTVSARVRLMALVSEVLRSLEENDPERPVVEDYDGPY